LIAGLYDSRPETYEHIAKVRGYLMNAAVMLLRRAHAHDQTKLEPPELEAFDIYTPKLKDTVYGSDEYKSFLVEMAPALAHHYKHNNHHPEHFEDGIQGMSLLDLLEMVCDWKAASERTKAPRASTAGPEADTFAESFKHNQERFGYGDELAGILENTGRELGFIS
jgi:hypothetical protein